MRHGHLLPRGVVLIVICAGALLQAQIPATPSNTVATDFTFRDGGSRVVSISLTDVSDKVGFIWPEEAVGPWDTALLGVEVVASASMAMPFVEIAAGNRSERQYFRSGDAGPRWINLSFLRGVPSRGSGVALRGDGVTIAAGTASLRLFDNRLDFTKSTLVLAPHPDDAEIAAFGVYASSKATVVTVTAGNAGPRSYDAVFDNVPDQYHYKGRVRVIDSITVPWLGGIPPERAFNMGYFDARLAEMHDHPGKIIPEMYSANTDIGAYLQYNIASLLPTRSRASTWANLVDDLERVLKKVKPAVILAPHPQLDDHRDHQFVTVALAEAMARWRKNATFLLYTNHADQNRYPYGPAGTLISVPPPIARSVGFDRIYSHPLSREVQRLKLFALDAMHDLRPSPSRMYQLTLGHDRTQDPERVDPMGGVNYLRRGPRSNEIFFVYSQDTLKTMVATFVEQWRARPRP